ncbi:MAG: hypothetical protein EAZ97_14750, partial [Bacteroidetes bacterium]
MQVNLFWVKIHKILKKKYRKKAILFFVSLQLDLNTKTMLGNLDNEVIFKKAFTDKIVFKAFVRDILGIDIEVDKIETEKKF